MAEPVSKLNAVPSPVAKATPSVVELAKSLAAAKGEQVAQNPAAALIELTRAAGARGVSPREAEAAAQLAYGLIFGMHSLVREYEAGPVVVELERRAADGEISADDRLVIGAQAAARGGPGLAALALADAEHEAALARDFGRAAGAVGVRVSGSGTSAREALAAATRREAQRMASGWALTGSGRAMRIERQLLPLLTSGDSTVRTRGNLLLQDMVRTSYAFPDCSQGPACPPRQGARGAIANSSVKADIAVAIVAALTPAQLRALDPGSAAALMLAIHQVPAFVVRDVSGVEVSRMSNDWSFVATGDLATPRDGLVWQVTDSDGPLSQAATASADKLMREGPPTVTYTVLDGALLQIRYAPKGRT